MVWRIWHLATLAPALVAAGCAQRGAQPGRRAQVARHTVAPGETLWAIAQRFGVSLDALQAANAIADPARLAAGHVLHIPAAAGRRAGPKPAAAGPRRATTAPAEVARRGVPGLPRRALAWPLRGALTSRFGPRGGRPHDGIDIGAPAGTPVMAAADGDVVFADVHRGYGKVVILRHADGLMTVYAHHRKNRVRVGQRVRRGQTIAEVGQTGHATGPHLHFEVRHQARPHDPLRHLPPVRRG